MQRYLAAAAVAAVCFTMLDTGRAVAQDPSVARVPSVCPSPTLLKDVPNLRVREGDQATVTVAGHKKPKAGGTPSPQVTVPGAPITVSARTMRPFYSLTFPLSTFTDILGKIK